MPEKPGDTGVWRCEACGEEIPGERAEPPLHHVHGCEDATGQSLVFSESTDSSQKDRESHRCELCGADPIYLHSITSEPRLPTGMQSRLAICDDCHDAIEDADGDDCAWCGSENASAVTVVGTASGDYTIGYLCLDCQDGVT
jgi:hypothetical protein